MTSVQVILNGLFLGAFYLLMAQGLNITFGVMKVVNFAHGAVIVTAGLLVAHVWRAWDIHPLLLLPVVCLAGLIFGAAVQWLIIERIRADDNKKEILTLLITFGLTYMMMNVASDAWGAEFQSIPILQRSAVIGSIRIDYSLAIGSLVALVLAALLQVWLRRATLGRALRATAQSEVGAKSCGINPAAIRVLGFAVGAALGSAAGTLIIMTQPVAPQSSLHFTILSFVVIALGGLGSNAGAAVGAAILGVSQTVAGYELGLLAQSAVPYILLLAIMLLRPAGILAGRGR